MFEKYLKRIDPKDFHQRSMTPLNNLSIYNYSYTFQLQWLMHILLNMMLAREGRKESLE